jgi:hypothetical protein
VEKVSVESIEGITLFSVGEVTFMKTVLQIVLRLTCAPSDYLQRLG